MPPTAGSSTAEPAAPHPRFFFDLASPEAYLTSERILQVMPVATEWVPVLLADAPPPDWAYVESAVVARGMQALVRPPHPFDAELANLAATYAKQIGRTVSFAQAAFRQAYAAGRDLSQPDWVVVSGSACEMHPTATLKAVTTRLVGDGLARATATARALGVTRTPALVVGARVLHGDAALEDAAALAAEFATS